MHFEQDASTGFVLRPMVVLSIVWLGLCGVWRVWVVMTTKYPTLDEPPGLQIMSGSEFWAATAVNVVLLLGLLRETWLCRRSPVGLRRGHWAGIALAFLTLGLLQYAFFMANERVFVSGG